MSKVEVDTIDTTSSGSGTLTNGGLQIVRRAMK